MGNEHVQESSNLTKALLFKYLQINENNELPLFAFKLEN